MSLRQRYLRALRIAQAGTARPVAAAFRALVADLLDAPSPEAAEQLFVTEWRSRMVSALQPPLERYATRWGGVTLRQLVADAGAAKAETPDAETRGLVRLAIVESVNRRALAAVVESEARRLIGIREALEEAAEVGADTDLARKLLMRKAGLSKAQARTWARTESGAAMNNATFEVGMHRLTPEAVKEWSSSGLPNVRPTHDEADLQEVEINQPFIVGGALLMHPGDGSRGAPAEEVINCQCSLSLRPKPA